MPDTQKLKDRIKKLLALSQSSNQHEAATAAARAAELMAEHQLSAAVLQESGAEAIGEFCVDRFGQRVAWKGTLAAGVAYANGCAVFWGYDAHDRARTLMFLGRKSDVDTAGYLYRMLAVEIDRLADAAWNEVSDALRYESARRFKHSFRIGAAATIGRRLRKQRDETLAAARASADGDTRQALVRIDETRAELEAYMKRMGLRASRPPRVSSMSGVGAGARAGHGVDLGRDRPGLVRAPLRLRGRTAR